MNHYGNSRVSGEYSYYPFRDTGFLYYVSNLSSNVLKRNHKESNMISMYTTVVEIVEAERKGCSQNLPTHTFKAMFLPVGTEISSILHVIRRSS